MHQSTDKVLNGDTIRIETFWSLIRYRDFIGTNDPI